MEKILGEKALIEAFIKDEDLALKRDVQGQVYTMKHQALASISRKTLNNLDEVTKKRFYYHLIRLYFHGFKIHKSDFNALQDAYIEILQYADSQPTTTGFIFKKPREHTFSPRKILFTCFYKLDASFLFGTSEYNENTALIVKEASLENYALCWGVIKQCNALVYETCGYAKMCAQSEKFQPFAENPLIVRRIINSLQDENFITARFPSNGTFWGFFMILILAEKIETIKEIIRSNPEDNVISIIESFLITFKQRAGINTLFNSNQALIRF